MLPVPSDKPQGEPIAFPSLSLSLPDGQLGLMPGDVFEIVEHSKEINGHEVVVFSPAQTNVFFGPPCKQPPVTRADQFWSAAGNYHP